MANSMRNKFETVYTLGTYLSRGYKTKETWNYTVKSINQYGYIISRCNTCNKFNSPMKAKYACIHCGVGWRVA